jgi:ubiquinol-cytochrome c reductase cytochrome b subunit
MTTPERFPRRRLLVKLGLLFNGVLGLLLTVPFVRYLLSPTRSAQRDIGWVSLGSLDRFPAGQTRLATFRNPVVGPSDGQTARLACWVRHVEADRFQVFAINCMHLGCPVRWFPQSSLFLCPCHGGAYYADGSRASGPPERGLFEYRYRIEGGSCRSRSGRCPPGVASGEGRRRAGGHGAKPGSGWREPWPKRWSTVPRQTASWAYVFGSGALTLFAFQLVTGVLLALLYVPSAAEAWDGLQAMNHQIAAGWYIRALHGWGSNFMVAIVLIHLVQVFLFGAYKFPRELTWLLGVLLLLLTLGMAFTGQVLRFDQDAYWGVGIGASISSRVPGMGNALVRLLLGGPIIGGATLSRFFALHVFVVPGILIGAVTLHVLMVLKLGVNEWPMPGRIVRRSTYLQDYQKLTEADGVPFAPYAIWKDIAFSGAMVLAVMVCAALLGPFGPSGPPDPTIIQTTPRPDYFFLWIYALLSYLPPSAETPVLLIAPVLVIAVPLVLLPFVAGGRREKLAEAAFGRALGGRGGGCARGAHPPGPAHSLEPGDGRVERASQFPTRLAGPHRAAAPGCGGVPVQAVPQLPCLGGRGGQRGPALRRGGHHHPGSARPRSSRRGEHARHGRTSAAGRPRPLASLQPCTHRAGPGADLAARRVRSER